VSVIGSGLGLGLGYGFGFGSGWEGSEGTGSGGGSSASVLCGGIEGELSLGALGASDGRGEGDNCREMIGLEAGIGGGGEIGAGSTLTLRTVVR
jgi:hypothetical protein